jgi:hypothetical protein
MAKTPEMEELLDRVGKILFGRSRKDPICVACGSTKVRSEDFRDTLSRREFELSHFCQECQDKTFGVNEEEED